MLKINNENITVTRGDSAVIAVTPTYDDNTVYTLAEGEYIVFRAFLTSTALPVVEKTSSEQNEEGALTIMFGVADTELPRGVYFYSVALIGADGEEKDTFIGGGREKPRFIIT